ncbi:MAG: DNA-binding protein [Mycobacteriaceae bacterium]
MATWTPEKVRAPGVRTDLATANNVLGISRNSGYQLVSKDDYPVPLLRLGNRYVVPVAGLLDLLGITEDRSATVAS